MMELIAAALAGACFSQYAHNFGHVRWWTTQQGTIIWDGREDNPKIYDYILKCQRDALFFLVMGGFFTIMAVLP